MASLPEASQKISSKKVEWTMPANASHSQTADETEEEPRAFSRESDIRFPNSIIVNNDKVRYYYNKTLCLRAPIAQMAGQLETLHGSTFAYLAQFPETGDYSIIGTLFELIATVSTMINWNILNQPCYWDDFCRESKQLSFLLDKVNGAALKCSDTATDILTKASEIFNGLIVTKRMGQKIDTALSYRKPSDYSMDDPRSQSIKIDWQKPGDIIELQWHDADGGLIKVSLNQTGAGFRLRFLRHIMYHARTCLEKAYVTFSRLNIALSLHIPIDKLAKCKDVEMKQLSPQEMACVMKAKREFDKSLDTIWNLVSRFKFQTFHLFKYNATFKGLRKSRDIAPKTAPTFMKLTMSVDDSLLMRVISCGIEAEAKNESFDFTVSPDRTDDIIAKIEDLLTVDNKSTSEFQHLLTLVKLTFPDAVRKLTSKEQTTVDNDIEIIFAHRLRVRQWLKKSVEMFETHQAFQKMDMLELLPTLKDISKDKRTEDIFLDEDYDKYESRRFSDNAANNNELVLDMWIPLDGNIKILYDGPLQGILAIFPYTNVVRSYDILTVDEQITISIRLIRHLLTVMANEQCSAKVTFDRICETKSLVKRLKLRERLDIGVQNAILEQHKNLTKMLKMTKALGFLKD